MNVEQVNIEQEFSSKEKHQKVVRVIKLWLFFVEFSLPISISLPRELESASQSRRY